MSETCIACVEKDTDFQLLQAKYKAALREAQLYKNKLNRNEVQDPGKRDIDTVLEYWHDQLGKDGRTKIPFDGARGKKVKWALQHFTVDDLKLAVDGLRKFPYVWDLGRFKERRPWGTSDQRSDDITSAFFDEKSIEAFMDRAKAPVPEGLVEVPQAALDAMKLRVVRAEYYEQLWREQAHANDGLVELLAGEVDVLRSRSHLRVVSAA